MGLISEKYRAMLDEMKARHAETDREIAALQAQVDESLAKIERHYKEMEWE